MISNFKGKKHTLEAISKNRMAHLGKIPWNKGKIGLYKLSEETRQKMSVARKGKKNPHKGHKISEETCIKIGNSNRNRVHSKESRKNMSIGYRNTLPEIRRKVIDACVLAHKGKKVSTEVRKKMSESHKGDKCHFWRGGITKENMKIRASLEYKLWRESVFERDNYTCIWCGAKSGNGKAVILNADHIKPFALFPELRLAIDNGRTLCRECHLTTDTIGRFKK